VNIEPPDAMLARLAELTPPTATDARIRMRCHAALAHGAKRSAGPARTWTRHLLDGALALAVGVYGVMIVAEGLRLLSR
jgi:hypothetical protein